MPALYALMLRRLLPPRFVIVGVARTEADDEAFRSDMKDAVQKYARDEFRHDIWDELAQSMFYVATDFADEGGENKLQDLLTKLDEERQLGGNRVYYLAVPPGAFPTIVEALGRRRSATGWTRLIVEKPFGHDLESARELNRMLREHFEENEIFRIDHYLGKETVQNMNALRFANGIFEPIWNRQFIDHVQITVAESIGIEGRAGYYERSGAIRDIFQNHLLQLLALTAMEPPIDFSAESVRNEKVKVLKALHTPGPKSVVRGQYGRGFVEGEEVVAYREEQGVAPDSMTETYVAAKLYVDNWRWADTPFYVRMGKRLARRETTIAIQFKRAPHPPFGEVASEGLRPNVLLVHVQPDEGVSLAIGAKVPGQGMTIRTVHMDFLYGGAFRTSLPEAYERLILDTLLGDGTLFTRADEVEEQWLLVDSIVAAWQRDRPSFPNYAAGTWGPPSADDLLHRDGRSSRSPRELEWQGRQARRGRGCVGGVARSDGVLRRPAEHPHLGDDAHRLGAGRMARPSAEGTRRHGGTPSVPHDPARPEARQQEPHRRHGHARVLRGSGFGAEHLLGDHLARPARDAREGAGVDRRAVADHRSARVPPLARRTAVGLP
jgi:glucose-6-phosphate 1-dehydrogenase